ncbi:replicative DNA helicase [Mycoplasma yeatsii]|uniref:Replicative DNA helicase n=1 Tax=Mycoplasma yeatsii TaxID=51365 RepID=A0ABU0NF58_9MOLU|nr:replicative DNA helicase [Mycoplasma yeatsii]AJM71602.1 replicative DNA helicase [Mycoplasma yeatsii GM274B]MDQ0568009.1 replicative DNA helicase [Mycoplasma yeatsii]
MKKELTTEQILDTENFVLSAAISNPNTLADITSRLQAEDFFFGKSKLIYQAILELNLKQKEISPISIIDFLNAKNMLKDAGGEDYIFNIAAQYWTDEGLESYIDRIHRLSIDRKLNNVIKELEAKRASGELEIDDLLKMAQTRLLDIDLESKQFEIESIGMVANKVINKIRELESKPDSLTGVPSGFSSLDKCTSGWQSSDFIILAARPSVGKTAFSLNLAYNAASSGYPVAFFSLEMPAEQLTQRLLSRISSIDSWNLRSGKGLDRQKWEHLLLAKDKLNKTPIYIDPTPGITIQQIRSKLYKMKRDHDIKLCVVDYLQLIAGSNYKDRQNEVSEISRQLKQIARETQIPIICLSQLSRRAETREDKRPMMSDLRDSGAIEQDADLVAFLYREDYYNKDLSESEKQKTELIIAKHRNGATTTVELRFIKDHGRFMDWN